MDAFENSDVPTSHYLPMDDSPTDCGISELYDALDKNFSLSKHALDELLGQAHICEEYDYYIILIPSNSCTKRSLRT